MLGGPPEPATPVALVRRPEEYVWDPDALKPGHRVDLLVSGSEAFPAMIEAIAGARRSVLIEIYILRGDDVGRAFGDALSERAQAGIPCYLLYDALGSIACDPIFLNDLVNAGVHVLAYRPIGPFRRRFRFARLGRRNHRKLVVVDGKVGFVGGLNFGEEYLSIRDGGAGWHDVHVRVEGPVARDLEQSFRGIWRRAGGTQPPPLSEVPATPVGPAAVAKIENRERSNRMSIRRAYLHAIATARQEILIENAYFIPDIGIRWALRRAIRRGVVVKVIVPTVSDVPAVQWASQHLFARLLELGVRLFAWPDRMMHAKAAVIDQAWVTIGSYNLDDRSLFYNLEINLAVADTEFGAEVARRFEEHLVGCRELTIDAWRRRPAWAKVLEWFFYRFKRWF